jgi:hypothetical protein
MNHILQGLVEHATTCTRMGVKGWLCRVYTNGKLNREKLATTRQEIGTAFRDMLRWECKCGNLSKMANRSRYRHWEKLAKLAAERKVNMAAPITTNKQ